MSSKNEIFTEGIWIWEKYFVPKRADSPDVEICDGIDTQPDNPNLADSSTSEGRLLIASSKRVTATYTPPQKRARIVVDENILRVEDFNAYVQTGKRSEKLEILYQSLLCIKPTSIRCEQNFSISKWLHNVKRMAMKVQTLSDLCVMQSYFKKTLCKIVKKWF